MQQRGVLTYPAPALTTGSCTTGKQDAGDELLPVNTTEKVPGDDFVWAPIRDRCGILWITSDQDLTQLRCYIRQY
ncbi:MAG: hypothetical protein IH594_13745 [Bacteroidales bacterium]|nr:hypothetical protein [Bacteroidales bacterium]